MLHKHQIETILTIALTGLSPQIATWIFRVVLRSQIRVCTQYGKSYVVMKTNFYTDWSGSKLLVRYVIFKVRFTVPLNGISKNIALEQTSVACSHNLG